MTIRKRFRCRNCGKKFEAEILDEDEQRETRRRNQPTSPIQCPECCRTDIREGWY